jgi:nucleoside-diphosphate-sugar epimerase
MAGVAAVSEVIYRRFLPGRRQLMTPAAVRLLSLGRRADTGKAQRELGYRPGSIADAVHEAYQWFVDRGVIERPATIAAGSRAQPAPKPRMS